MASVLRSAACYAVVSFGSSPQYHRWLDVDATGNATPAAASESAADLAVELRDFAIVGLPAHVAPGPAWVVVDLGAGQLPCCLLHAGPRQRDAARVYGMLTVVAVGG